MKKQLPLLVGFLAGLIAIGELYIPKAQPYQQRLLDWAQILTAMAFILGAINVIQVNYPKIRRRDPDWQFKVVLLLGAVGMGLVGVAWNSPEERAVDGGLTMAVVPAPAAAGSEKLAIHLDGVRRGAVVSVDGGPAMAAWTAEGEPATLAVEPGKHALRVWMPAPVAGYSEANREFEVSVNGTGGFTLVTPRVAFLGVTAMVPVARGEGLTIRAPLEMNWGPSGRVYVWLYDHVFSPCNATMFALLAFFIASAAFRAFRARNVEAALLLGAAILVMIGRVPIGRALSDWFPLISDWLVAIPNNAGRRAIMMGAALGAIATGLRIILGLERSHLGAD